MNHENFLSLRGDLAKKYGLADESKALRCLLNYASEKKDDESSIFEEVRCVDC